MRKFINLLLLYMGLSLIFIFGVLLYNYLNSAKVPPIPVTEQSMEQYDLVIISEKDPRMILFVDYYIDRSINKIYFGQAHFFNGTSWISDPIFESNLHFANAGSLEQYISSVKGEIKIDRKSFVIDIPELPTPMTIRADEKFVKFGGGTRTPGYYLSVDGEKIMSKAMLLKGYDKEFFTISHKDYGINTYWLMFMGGDGKYWHVDVTTMEKQHPKYEPHSFFAIYDPYANSIELFGNNISIGQNEKDLILEQGDLLKEFKFSNEFKRLYKSENYIIKDNEGGIGLFLRYRN